ncbi:uncharacterized protein PAN0_014d4919 [Moesziomyces antarcticus]|uniref:Uncharacterized protein n=2 Tax=Pseudozyma antarctica TaxID=84753 RepID=A0A5C3FTM7_PSEA2|nr:uncharacterized protein PAN0_014d4919 [Moesziomyces antarcticus]GAK66696.1 hypothetical protein PAN0_014d4919 [Moesziomyces antarcticus]SPO47743.1 uncharacterized protein PSANT_05431 [Moesziomyces antarcticus]
MSMIQSLLRRRKAGQARPSAELLKQPSSPSELRLRPNAGAASNSTSSAVRMAGLGLGGGVSLTSVEEYDEQGKGMQGGGSRGSDEREASMGDDAPGEPDMRRAVDVPGTRANGYASAGYHRENRRSANGQPHTMKKPAGQERPVMRRADGKVGETSDRIEKASLGQIGVVEGGKG